MNSPTRSVAVVATRLPSIDRRALSQAWYSALHLQAASGVRSAPSRAAALASPGNVARPARDIERFVPRASSLPATRPAHPSRSATVAVDRRAPAGELARRIERAIARHTVMRSQAPATLSVKTGDGRVALLVRTDGGTTRIVALCAPQLRERVDRALAHARFSLAASGMSFEVAR